MIRRLIEIKDYPARFWFDLAYPQVASNLKTVWKRRLGLESGIRKNIYVGMHYDISPVHGHASQ
jgi:hypothetical protein